MKVIAIAGLAFLFLLYLITRPRGYGTYKPHIPSGRPPAVLVTVLDEGGYDKAYLEMIKDNRIQYAQKHGTSLVPYMRRFLGQRA